MGNARRGSREQRATGGAHRRGGARVDFFGAPF
jgi:hypothetical protein